MHGKVILFSSDRSFVETCTLALPAEVSVLQLSDFSELEKILSAGIGFTILADESLYPYNHIVEPLCSHFSHCLFYFSSRIGFEGFKNQKCKCSLLPFGLKKLISAFPGLFFLTADNCSKTDAVLGSITGKSVLMQNVRKEIKIAADQNCSVLFTGENGTGKSLAAVVLHQLSSRKKNPIVMENAASISESLFESELFGSMAGAYTGSEFDRPGLFGQAHNSTLFLDEISEISMNCQSKLLQALQTGLIRSVGAEKSRFVDVRTVFATNADLKQRIRERKFRADLFYRISQIIIEMPPLRNRKEDIPELAGIFLSREKYKKYLTARALEKLTDYNWPGNVRELENVLRKGAIHSEGDFIDSDQIEFYPQDLQLL